AKTYPDGINGAFWLQIKELMVDHKKRAEKRRAYYESKMGDPKQLLRIVGTAVKLYPDADQFYQHENVKNLYVSCLSIVVRRLQTLWQGDNETRIDRFDGRALLEYLPSRSDPIALESRQDRDIANELEFERYRDLVEVDRLEVTEQERLVEIDEEWTDILARHKALLSLLNPKYDSGNTVLSLTVNAQVDILNYIEKLSHADKEKLNEMASRYNIHNYVRLLRGAKKDRDKQLELLRRQQQTSSESEASDDDHPAKAESDNFIVFGTTASHHSDDTSQDTKKRHDVGTKHNTAVSKPTLKQPEKKLSPMEKLKLKMRAAFDGQIQKDEEAKRKKEREAEIDKLHGSDNTEALLRLTKPDLDLAVQADTEKGPGTVREDMAVDTVVKRLQKGIVHGAIRAKDDHLLDRGQEAGTDHA
ncbi:hypothetical protein INT43_008458, partial [Umbelopsis isabellina]